MKEVNIPKYFYTIITVLAVCVSGFWVRSCVISPSSESPDSPETAIVEKIPNAYILVMNDDVASVEVDTKPCKYYVESKSSSWVQSGSEGNFHWTKMDMLTMNTYRARLGFNPVTLKGSWSRTYKKNYIAQKGTLTLVPNPQGGFEVIFHADNGFSDTRGTLLPVWN